jgi:hypothetical protein
LQKFKEISTRVSCEFEFSLLESSETLKSSEQNFKNIIKTVRYKDIESSTSENSFAIAPEVGVRRRTKLIFIALYYHSSEELLRIAILSNRLTLPLLAAFFFVLGGKLILRNIPPRLIVLAANMSHDYFLSSFMP